MLLNSGVTDVPEVVRRTHAARRRRRREKFIFWKGVSAAQGSPGMKFKSDMEDLTSPGRLPSQTWNVEPVTMRALSKATRHAFLSLEHQ